MTFANPQLLALAPLALLLVSLAVTAQWRRSVRLMEAYGGAEPARRMAARDLEAFPTLRLAAGIAAALALVVAASDPSLTPDEPVSEQPLDLVVALDISLSMTAEDVGTPRARRAAEVLAALADALPEEYIGVEVFADWPYTLVPLTHDLDVVRFFGATVTPDLVSDRDQGTGLGAVLTHARSTLDARRRDGAEPAILLLSDGESYEEPAAVLDSVAAATADGVRLWTAGVGTAAGGPLPRPGVPGDVFVDETGAPVISRLDDELLRQMAGVGGGRYFDVSRDGGLRSLVDELAGEARRPDDSEAGLAAITWMSLLALLLLLLEGTLDSPHRWPPRRGRGGTG